MSRATDLFAGKVAPENEHGCMLWVGYRNRAGYGQVSKGGGSRLAHRRAWESLHGAIPPGLLVCHRCDTPACVNPEHLFLGTHKENMADSSAKRRNAWPDSEGESNGRAKLATADVLAIRHMLTGGQMTQAEVGASFGISQTAVSAIARRVRWAHV